MITLHRGGLYKLIETKNNTKVLYLDNDVFAWVEPTSIGEMLIASHKTHKADCILSMGEYRIYSVDDEPKLTDSIHLELDTGRFYWQGYLLLTGLPDNHKKRARIVPTHETITGNPLYENRKDIATNLAVIA